jgi:hypothetical protein
VGLEDLGLAGLSVTRKLASGKIAAAIDIAVDRDLAADRG